MERFHETKGTIETATLSAATSPTGRALTRASTTGRTATIIASPRARPTSSGAPEGRLISQPAGNNKKIVKQGQRGQRGGPKGGRDARPRDPADQEKRLDAQMNSYWNRDREVKSRNRRETTRLRPG